MDLSRLLDLPLPHCLPFRAMATHPQIIRRLNWIQGPGSKLNGIGTCIVSEAGCGGQTIHANGTPLEGTVNAFAHRDGRFFAGSVNIAWQLAGVRHVRDGGLVILPGSHKANMACPIADPGGKPYEGLLSFCLPILVHMENPYQMQNSSDE